MLSDGFESVHLAFIKRFEFPEPVFYPEKLKRGRAFSKKGDYRFFCDPDSMNKQINAMEKTELPVGIMKPIKNLNIPKDNYWRPFRYKEMNVRLTKRLELPYYPFQVIPSNVGLTIDRGKIESITGMDIIDSKVDAQIRLFPPGIGTVHLYLYINPKDLDTENLLKLTRDPRCIRISSQKGEKNIFEFFNSFINMVMNHLSERKYNRDIPGYFLLFNFQGKGIASLSQEDMEDFSEILQNSPSKKMRKITEKDNCAGSKTDTDLMFISKKTAILFVDEGIRNLGHPRILKGRKCFRTHFLNTLEMAYNVEWLLKHYDEYLRSILCELEKVPLAKGAQDKMKQVMTANIFDPCIYSTLVRSVLPIRENLSKISGFYAKIFDHAAAVMGVPSLVNALNTATEQLYEKASKWDVQGEFFKKVYAEVKPLITGFIDERVINP
jgi:hypothetical protein